MRRDISWGRDISVPELSRAGPSFFTFTLCSSHFVHRKPRQLGDVGVGLVGGSRYLGMEDSDRSRGEVVSVHVNGSPRDVSGAKDNFADSAHALRGYQAPLPETARDPCFSREQGQFHPTPGISLFIEITRLIRRGIKPKLTINASHYPWLFMVTTEQQKVTTAKTKTTKENLLFSLKRTFGQYCLNNQNRLN